MPSIIGIGEILWDMLPPGKQLGGAPMNFAFHVHKLGMEALPVSAVGKDRLGKEILEVLGEIGLDTKYIQINDEFPTGTVDVELDNSGMPDYIIHENTAWDNIKMNDELFCLAGKADAVCFGSLCQRTKTSNETINKFLSIYLLKFL